MTERMTGPKAISSWPSTRDFIASGQEADTLDRLPVRTDLREAIGLGMRHLVALFDADRDDEPFFYSNHRVDGTGEMHHSVSIGIPHVVGRCLLGGLAGEEATGIPFSPEGLGILERYLRGSFANEDHLNSYFDPKRGGQRYIELHNMREGLYGLVCLARARGSAWAREKAGRMLATLESMTDEGGAWSMERAAVGGLAGRCEGMSVWNAARLVEPLLECYELTGDPRALALTAAYARKGLEVMFEEDGRFSPAMERSSGHVHSITSSLSGMVRYARFVGDPLLLMACRRIMDRGVPQYFSSWGWGDEVYPDHEADVVGRGEINQTGDVVRTALALGAAGEPRYYELAERYLRSMLLPTQHREAELRRFLKDAPDPRGDAERDVLRRTVGGYSMQLPNDRMREGDWPLSTLDITSGAVHAMAECWRARTVRDPGGWRVNLHLDFEGEEISLKSFLPIEGRLDFSARVDVCLKIRVPEWVDRNSLSLTIGGKDRAARVSAGYMVIERLDAGERGSLRFPIPCRKEKETVDGTEYETTWVGNQVVRILPRGTVSPLPF